VIIVAVSVMWMSIMVFGVYLVLSSFWVSEFDRLNVVVEMIVRLMLFVR